MISSSVATESTPTRDGVCSATREATVRGPMRLAYNLSRPARIEWGELYFGPDSKVGLYRSPDADVHVHRHREPEMRAYPTSNLARMMRERLLLIPASLPSFASRSSIRPAGVQTAPKTCSCRRPG